MCHVNVHGNECESATGRERAPLRENGNECACSHGHGHGHGHDHDRGDGDGYEWNTSQCAIEW